MLIVFNALQLVLYIALLAMLGQGVLFVLAGAKRDQNFFYSLLRVLTRPFIALVRRFTPAKVADTHVPVVTFFLLLIVYVVITFEKINLCLSLGMAECK